MTSQRPPMHRPSPKRTRHRASAAAGLRERAWRTFRKSKMGMAGLVILVFALRRGLRSVPR